MKEDSQCEPFSYLPTYHGDGRADWTFEVYDEAGNVIETHEHTGDFKEW